jgi:hypothetical protein
MPKHRHITGLGAARLANEQRPRLSLLPPGSAGKQPDEPVSSSPDEVAKKAPPRLLRQPAKRGEVLLAPKAELQAHKAAFREVFGDTLSDEFVDEMLTQLESTLAPGAWDSLEPTTLNAAIAIIASVKPQTELEALIAVQIVATGFAGLKFLRHGRFVFESAVTLPSLINSSRATGEAAITSNVSPASIRPTNSELRPVTTLSWYPDFFSNSGPISANTVPMARDAKIFSSAERAVPCDMHTNSMHATSEATARDLI